MGVVTNYGEGELQNGGGGHVKFYPCEKGGGRKKVLAMLKGRHKKFGGSFYAVAWSFSHIGGGVQKVSTL